MPVSISFIRELEELDPQLRRILLSMLEELERQREESVTKVEFNELKEIVRDLGKSVKDLAEAQKQTEKRVEELTEAQKRTETRLEELAEAQKQTEKRVDQLAIRLEELAEAQKQTEKRVDQLALRLEELTEAQKRTEARLEELAEAQKQTEKRVDQLALRVEELTEAQKKTEEEIAKLVKRMDIFEERLDGISNSVGYSLENVSYRALPRLLAEKYGLEVEGRLIRRYVSVGQKDIQMNIYGHARKNGSRLLILGECKVRPSKREIVRFEKYARRIAQNEGLEPFLVFVAHDFPPKIEEFLCEKQIAYFWSYDLE